MNFYGIFSLFHIFDGDNIPRIAYNLVAFGGVLRHEEVECLVHQLYYVGNNVLYYNFVMFG